MTDKGLVESTNYSDYYRELTDTICKLVRLTRPITTQHQNKSGDWTEEDQLSKVCEETFEIIKANYHESQDEYSIENLDLLFATLTQIHKSELTDQQIKFSIGHCLAKFHKRGWFTF